MYLLIPLTNLVEIRWYMERYSRDLIPDITSDFTFEEFSNFTCKERYELLTYEDHGNSSTNSLLL